jgi:hypothetical protein
MGEKFEKLVGGRSVIRADYLNRLTNLALRLERCLMAAGFSDSNGIYIRHTAAGGAGTQIRRAYCKTDAPADTKITCYLNTDETGTEIDVYCAIAGGGNLNVAYPRLTDGLEIPVWYDVDTWKCLWGFQNLSAC